MIDLADWFIADCHVHGPARDGSLWQPFHATGDYQDYLRYLRRCGVRVAVQNAKDAVQARSAAVLRDANEHALTTAVEGTGRRLRIIPACITHPRFPRVSVAILRRFRQAGSCWAGEVCPYAAGYPADRKNLFAMAEVLEGEGFVFQMHQIGAELMDELAEGYPALTLVFSHLGQPAATIPARLEVARRRPNVYLDICGSGHERMGAIELGVEMGIANKFLYGSDFPINEPGGPIIRVLNARIPVAVKRKILGGNLRRLFADRGIRI